ncbi:MAG: protein-disulfide reductase DsbD, partial [Epsilonproteobacteria bacterium]|nr:protein-disulfide reductase DsbD [Campylobacterota bacterium]
FYLTLFFFVGVLLSFTPCILPMVPILSSIIIQQAGGKEISRGKSFFISLVYVVSMSFTYALIGVVAGLLNFDIQANMNNPFIIIPIALIFVALALSLFGYFDLALPASWQNKLNKISSKGEGKGVIGTAIMGAISALIVGTCTAPVISGAILFISMSGNALLGGISLFVMGMGAGLPLLLVGAGAKNLVPKPGGWMVRVSQTFGILMLAMAIYIIRGVIPQELYMILIASLLVGVALFIGIFEKRSGFKILLSIFAYFLLILGTIEFIGALAGAKSSLRPLEPFTSSKVIKKEEVIVNEAKGYTLEKLLEEVKNAKKPVIVDIGKENCAACSELATITFPNKDVQKAMKRFKFIKIDITKNSKDDQKILKHFKLFGAPNIIFFDSNGTYLNEKSLTGFIKPKDFIEHIKDIK